MGIQISSTVTQPQVVFDKIFLQRLSIDQYVVAADAPPPKYHITIEYRLYGVKDGQRYYHADIREMEVADFIALAMSQAQKGDTTILSALPPIEAAVAALIAIDLNTTAEVI